jgi:TPR repeat protein
MLTALNDKGHFDSASDLGRYYQDGRVASKDPERAFSLFEYAAQNGSAAGQFNVGKAYRDGVGIARDEIKAAFWMSKAAIQGLDEAANALAKLPPQARESANIRLAASGLSVDTRDALVTTASTQTNEQTAMRVAAGRQREADRLLALMQKQLEEERQANALQKLRQEQEKEKQREQERLVEMRRNLDAEAKLAAAKKATEESLAEAQRRQEEKLEQERLAEIKRKQEEAQRLLAQQRKEDERRAAVQLQLDQQAEAQRIKEEQAQAISTARRFYANRKALVIGNDQYQFVNKLSNAVADAKAIGKSLEGLGYQVNLQTDLDEKRMKKALRVFREGIQGGDEVLFYYAGHGTQIGATNYLLPTDIQGENEAQVRDEAIQLQRILDDMSEQKAKFTLVVIDACRDNPFKVAGRAIGGRGLAPTSAATGQMVIFSAGTGQQALDNLGSHDKDPNGVFTRTFLKEIEKPGISVDRVLRNVRSQVIALARSVGREQTPALYDQADGDFYLNPPK